MFDRITGQHLTACYPVDPMILAKMILALLRTAVVRAHLGAAAVTGPEAETTELWLLHQDRILRSIKVPAEIHARCTERFGIQTGALLEGPHELETGGHARPAFFLVYAMSPPAAISSCMKGGTD